MYGIFFPKLTSVISEKACLPPMGCWNAKIRFFLHRYKLHKNTFVLVGTVHKTPEFVGPSQDAQKVWPVTKGNTFLKRPF